MGQNITPVLANISKKHFDQEHFCSEVRAIISKYGVDELVGSYDFLIAETITNFVISLGNMHKEQESLKE